MPIYKKKNRSRKVLIWTIVIVLLILMIVSFSPNPEMNEIVLWP